MKQASKTALLLIEILRHIPKQSTTTSQKIYEALKDTHNISKRSIERHLQTLCEEFDVECDKRSKPYGYRWEQYAKGINLINLTPQDSLLLCLAEQQLSTLLPKSLQKNFAQFFEQAKKNLESYNEDGSKTNKLESQWLNKVRVVPARQPLLPPEIDGVVLDEVTKALYNNQWLDIDYKKPNGEEKTYHVMPLGLAQQGERLYLVIRYNLDDEKPYSLALHRMQSATISNLEKPFDYPIDFNLEEYEKKGKFFISSGEKIKLTFNITPEQGLYLTETPLSQDQKIEKHDSYWTVTATVIDSFMLKQWLNSYGDDIWVIKKEEIDNS